jgi:hypothetical protein
VPAGRTSSYWTINADGGEMAECPASATSAGQRTERRTVTTLPMMVASSPGETAIGA